MNVSEFGGSGTGCFRSHRSTKYPVFVVVGILCSSRWQKECFSRQRGHWSASPSNLYWTRTWSKRCGKVLFGLELLASQVMLVLAHFPGDGCTCECMEQHRCLYGAEGNDFPSHANNITPSSGTLRDVQAQRRIDCKLVSGTCHVGSKPTRATLYCGYRFDLIVHEVVPGTMKENRMLV